MVIVAANPPRYVVVCCPLIRRRHVICFLCFLVQTMNYLMRVCLSVTITVMTRHHYNNVTDTTNLHTCPCKGTTYTNDTNTSNGGEFSWDEEMQGIILSSFFWGYFVSQLPGGIIAERMGGKRVLGLALLVSTICTLLTPMVARHGNAWGLVALRVIMGLGQGVLYPCLNVLLAKWAPLEERAILSTLVFSGSIIGIMLSMLLTGLLISWANGGWASVFYVYSGAGFVLLGLWIWLGYSRPQDHPGLSFSEKTYLNEYAIEVNLQKEQWPIPWKAIMTSGPLWGLVVARSGVEWGAYTVINELPKYMSEVLHLSIVQTGLYSSLPYVALWLVGMVTSAVADTIIAREITSVTVVRKVFGAVAAVGPAAGLLWAAAAGCNDNQVILAFVFTMSLHACYYPSLNVNCLDLSSNFAGTIMGIASGISSIAGAASPYAVGLLVTQNSLEQWQIVFGLSAAVFLLTYLVFLVLGSGKTQPWNDPPRLSKVQSQIQLSMSYPAPTMQEVFMY